MGFLKEQCPRDLLAKNENFGANCLQDRSPVMLRKFHTNPSKLFWVDPKNIRRVCMKFSEYNQLTSQSQFAGLSAGTGKLCIFGHLGLVFIWSCFVSCLLLLLYYVICAPVLTEGTQFASWTLFYQNIPTNPIISET